MYLTTYLGKNNIFFPHILGFMYIMRLLIKFMGQLH